MTAWWAWQSPIRSVVHIAQCHFFNSSLKRCYLHNMRPVWCLPQQIPPAPTIVAQGMYRMNIPVYPFSIHSETSHLLNYLFPCKSADFILKAPLVALCLKQAAQVESLWRNVKMIPESKEGNRGPAASTITSPLVTQEYSKTFPRT